MDICIGFYLKKGFPGGACHQIVTLIVATLVAGVLFHIAVGAGLALLGIEKLVLGDKALYLWRATCPVRPDLSSASPFLLEASRLRYVLAGFVACILPDMTELIVFSISDSKSLGDLIVTGSKYFFLSLLAWPPVCDAMTAFS